VLGTLGNSFGPWGEASEHTTPEADDLARAMVEMRDRGASYVAMEVSSHSLELGRVRGVRFRAAAFTNLTQDHLDFHGTMARYGEAKAKLFLELGPGSVVLNVGDPFGRELARRARSPIVRVSAEAQADAEVFAVRSRVDAHGVEATVQTPRGQVQITSKLVGAHNLENLLVALGVAHALDLDLERAAAALSAQPGVPGRLERCDGPDDDLLALVDYAHTPDALSRALAAVREVAGEGRVWCVFGCGGDRDPTKRPAMGEAVARGADVVVVTTDNPRTEDPAAIADAVVKGVRAAGRDPLVELDRRKAIDLAVRSARSGDVVLVAGKGHERYQVVGNVQHPFDDRIEARRSLEQRRLSPGRNIKDR
jgi:UDP-N-acetylmuramoyl-L-alanyl-D-glutamate--2,6-diaminopimelate ligase